MSTNYSEGLSECDNKGVCGLKEIYEDESEVTSKVHLLSEWLKQAKCVVVYCGAGISTSAGIPDFRGPNGIWTQEKKGIKPDSGCNSFADCEPTQTHMALKALLNAKLIKFMVSQNIDGLFLRANIHRRQIAELHGNFYLDQCTQCKTRFIRSTPSSTMGQKISSTACYRISRNVKPCHGLIRDTICDWDQDLPKDELRCANKYSRQSDLSICLGTSLQIEPAASMPLLSKKINNGRLVIVNLQPTRFDRKADLVIHDSVDNVMTLLCQSLSILIPKYDKNSDPTMKARPGKEWRR